MYGRLPTKLSVGGIDYDIRSDYRNCILILQAFQDPDLSKQEAGVVMLRILFVDWQQIPEDCMQEAYDKGIWFLNCGDTIEKPNTNQRPLYDFEQDEQIIFSAINKVAGKEIRSVDYLHFWTFMGLFNEIGECTFSTVVSIRDKKRKHKKLENWEKDFSRNNPDMVNLKVKRSAEELEQEKRLKDLLG